MPKLQIKATLTDIEAKLDRNGSPFYKLSLSGFPQHFYAFATDYNLKESTLKSLKETPEKLVNHLVLLTYEEIPNKDSSGSFLKVREIQIL